MSGVRVAGPPPPVTRCPRHLSMRTYARADARRTAHPYKGNYDNLVVIKKKYDPGNLFHINQNIKP
jgi:hypothetical protein